MKRKKKIQEREEKSQFLLQGSPAVPRQSRNFVLKCTLKEPKFDFLQQAESFAASIINI